MNTPRGSDETNVILQKGAHVFGRYTLTEWVGKGGMGVVWRAYDETLGREVALKFLPDDVRRDPKAIRDLKRETNNCLALTHANIVRVHTFEEDALAAAIVMEYVAGSSLLAIQAARPDGCFDVADLAPLVRQLCAALDHAHVQAKVVHRDLKPGNLLVTADGVLKVVDFGIARSLADTHTRQTAELLGSSGTLGYMSPQQLDGGKDVPAHDIYALGATLYDLLTGEPPFHKGDIMGQIRSAAPAPLAARRADLGTTGAPIPREWEATILACLAKEAADRPRSAGEVAQRLGLAGGDLTARFEPRAERRRDRLGAPPGAAYAAVSPGRPKARFGLWLGFGAAVAALAVSAVVFWLKGEKKSSPVEQRIVGGPLNGSPRNQTGLPASGRPAINPPAVVKPETLAPPVKDLAPAPAINLSATQKPEAETVRPILPASRTADQTAPPREFNVTVNPPAAAKPEVEPARPVPPVSKTTAQPALPREFTVIVDPPDAGAHLWLGPQSNIAINDGKATLKDLPDGEHELVVQAAGYQLLTTRVTVKDGRGSAEARLVAVKGAVEIVARPGTVITAVDARGRETRLGSVPAGGALSSGNLLTIGSYTFKLAHADYAPVEQKNVELLLGRTAKLALEQTPLPGELRVFSVPTGAQVTVNGKAAGATPATLRDQPSETALAIEVFARGYRRGTQTVTLKPNETRTVNVGTLAAESGGLGLRFSIADFRVEPPKVLIDGKAVEVGRVVPNAPLLIEGLEIGTRSVEIAHPDYAPWKQSVTVRDQQNTAVAVTLTPKPAVLTLAVTGPADFTLSVNGKPVTALAGRVTVPAGEELALEVVAKGFKSAARRLTLPANGRQTWEVVLEKQAFPAPGEPWENTLGMKFAPVPGTAVLFGVGETRVQDFEVFVKATKRAWVKSGEATHPVVNVSWDDAQAFCGWLTETERAAGRLGREQSYRLPGDADWSVAVLLNEPRGGTPMSKNGQIKNVYPWGPVWPPPAGAGNYASSLKVDPFDGTAPVGSFAANRHGLYDLGGNVWEWCEDFYDGKSGTRVLRGASFILGDQSSLLSSYRSDRAPGGRSVGIGFRCVVAVGGASVP